MTIDAPIPATAAEIAAIRRRYLWMVTSVFFLDLAITLIFTTIANSWADVEALPCP